MLQSALISEKMRAFEEDIDARVRLLEQDARTGMEMSRTLTKEIARVMRHRSIETTGPDTKPTYRG
jgi:hypothetical protein